MSRKLPDPKWAASKITLAYLLVGVLWILISDIFLDWYLGVLEPYNRAQTFKGVVFVVLTAALLYTLVRRTLREQSRLTESVKRLAAIVESSADIIFSKTLDGVITSWNPAAQRAYGYTAEEIIGQSIYLLVPPDRHDELRSVMAQLAAGHRVERFETARVKKSGERFDVSVTLSPITDPGGRVVGISAIARDITDRRRTEHENRLLLHALGERVKEMTVLQRSAEILQDEEKSDSALLGEILAILPSGWQYVEIAAARVRFGDLDLRTENYSPSSWSLSARFNTADGRTGEVEVVYLEEMSPEDEGPFLAEERVVINSVAELLRTAFNRRAAEQSLRESETRFRALFENALEAVFIADDQGVYVDANPAACKLLGLPHEKIIGRPMQEFLEAAGGTKHDERWRAFLAAESQQGTSTLLLAGGRQAEVEYSARANFIPGLHLFIARDVTERRDLQEQLLQSQKMEAIGRLAGGIAHDFNNLLTAIMGYAQLTLMQAEPGSQLGRNLEEVRKAGERAAALTQKLLAFSRKQVVQPRVLNLNAVIQDMGKMIGRLIGEDIDIRTSLASDLWQVKADPGQVEQVLMNLVVNARDAMPEGGRLTVETENVHLDEEYARHHLDLESGDYVMLAVSDTGAGMKAETLARIFEPFFTTKEAGKGTGLGLSMVYGIVKQSGGHIAVYTEPGVGTTFKVYFPKTREAPERARTAPADLLPLRGHETVLLVEDEEAVRTLARRILEHLGYTVIESSNGVDALQTLEQQREAVHLIITDVIMPAMSGRQFADAASAIYPGIKVLFMSGYTDDAILHHGVLDPGVFFLQKPFTTEALAAKVREVLGTS